MSWKEPEYETAWRTAFRGEHGGLLVASLQAIVAEIPSADLSALQVHHGRRSFAAELLRMAEGVHGVPAKPAPPKQDDRLPGRRIAREKT